MFPVHAKRLRDIRIAASKLRPAPQSQHLHTERVRPPCHCTPDIAVSHNPHALAANLDGIELVPDSRHLAAHHAAQSFGEEKHRADGELSQNLAEHAARISKRYRTCGQLGKQHAVEPGGT